MVKQLAPSPSSYGRRAAEAEAAIAKETKRVLDLEIERLKLEIARLRRQRFGSSSERSTRLEQLELALTELQETAPPTPRPSCGRRNRARPRRTTPRRRASRHAGRCRSICRVPGSSTRRLLYHFLPCSRPGTRYGSRQYLWIDLKSRLCHVEVPSRPVTCFHSSKLTALSFG